MFDILIAYAAVIVALSSLVTVALEVVQRLLAFRHLWLRLGLRKVLERAGFTDGEMSKRVNAIFRDPQVNPAGLTLLSDVPGPALRAFLQREASKDATAESRAWLDDEAAWSGWWQAFEAGLASGYKRWMMACSFVLGTMFSAWLGIDAFGLSERLASSPGVVTAALQLAGEATGGGVQTPSADLAFYFDLLHDRLNLEVCGEEFTDPSGDCAPKVATLMLEADRLIASNSATTIDQQVWGIALSLGTRAASLPREITPRQLLDAARKATTRTDQARRTKQDPPPDRAAWDALFWRELGKVPPADLPAVQRWISALELDPTTTLPGPGLYDGALDRAAILDQGAWEKAGRAARLAARDLEEAHGDRLGFAGVWMTDNPALRLVGHLLMGLFIGAGAPYWFHLLNRLVAARNLKATE